MSIIKRFSNIMSANVRSLFNKSDNPEKEIKEYINMLELQIGKLNSESDANEVNRSRLRRELDECEESIYKYERYEKKAMENGKLRDAKIYLAKKEELMPRYNDIKAKYDDINKEFTDANDVINKLREDISILKSKLNEFNSYSDNKGQELNEKIDKAKFKAEALEELNNLDKDLDDDFDKEFEKMLEEDNN